MFGARTRGQNFHMLAILPIERQGDWLDACLLCGGGRGLIITQVASPREAAAALRQHNFDLLIFWQEGSSKESLQGWDQLAELTGHEGFVALGMQVVDGWHEPLIDAGAIACLDMDQVDPVSLVNTLRTSAELEQLRGASYEWEQESERRRERETREIDRALAGQRSLLERLDQFGCEPSSTQDHECEPAPSSARLTSGDVLTSAVGQNYLIALQQFIFDEHQTPASAVANLAEYFREAGASSSAIMRVHLWAVTQLTSGAGAGSLRHCLAGADRFIMELLMRMIDGSGEDARLPALENVRLHSPASPLAAA